jgi:hypothetical protein
MQRADQAIFHAAVTGSMESRTLHLQATVATGATGVVTTLGVAFGDACRARSLVVAGFVVDPTGSAYSIAVFELIQRRMTGTVTRKDL